MIKLFQLSKLESGEGFGASGFYSGLPCTHASALIKENLRTAHVNFPFIPSPKSTEPTAGGDFFVTNLLLFPRGYCHCSPVSEKHQVLLKVPRRLACKCLRHPCIQACHIAASVWRTFGKKRPSRGGTRKKTRLSPWFTVTSFSRATLTEKRRKTWQSWSKLWRREAKWSESPSEKGKLRRKFHR